VQVVRNFLFAGVCPSRLSCPSDLIERTQ